MLQCRSCGGEYPLECLYRCRICGGILEVRYNYERAFECDPVTNPDRAQPGIWKYRGLLPVKHAEHIVSLGEGETPLLHTPALTDFWGCDLQLYIKADSLNPSGSFKDRPTSVGVSVAKEQGSDKIVVASSGNAASSAAAYAARAGMDCMVFVPESTDISKVVQAQSYGARVFCVPGTFSDAYGLAQSCAERFNWCNVTSTFVNPYTLEGDKTIAYELYRQMRGAAPDYLLIPIGSGPLLVGAYKGYEELRSMGLIQSVPKMIGVQARQCAPITDAYTKGKTTVSSWEAPIRTIAGGIADPLIGYAGDGTLTLQTVHALGGVMVSLTEEEIQDGMTTTEKKIGLYCEPAGSVSVAAVKKLWAEGIMPKGSSAVSVMTGSGFKYSGRKPHKPLLVRTIEQVCLLN